MPRITDLPLETIHLVLRQLDDPTSVLRLGQTSRRMFNICRDQMLWRHFCRQYWLSWDPARNMESKFEGPVDDVDWLELYSERQRIDRQAASLLDSIIRHEHGRIDGLRRLNQLGLDAVDLLATQAFTLDEADDIFARRFWAKAALSQIHMYDAVSAWIAMLSGQRPRNMLHVLAGFELCIRTHSRGVDMASTIRQYEAGVDALCAQVLAGEQGDVAPTTRSRVKAAVACLDARFMKSPIAPPWPSHHQLATVCLGYVLDNYQIGINPWTRAILLCHVLQRLGVDAAMCWWRYHPDVVVASPVGLSLDGEMLPPEQLRDSMQVDCHIATAVSSSSSDDLLAIEKRGICPVNHFPSLEDAESSHRGHLAYFFERCHEQIGGSLTPDGGHEQLPGIPVHKWPSPPMAFYAVKWAHVVQFLLPGPQRSPDPWFQGLDLSQRIQQYCPWDIVLLNRLRERLASVCDVSHHDAFKDVGFALRIERLYSEAATHPVLRAPEDPVLYKIGQLVRHRRTGQLGVVVHWATSQRQSASFSRLRGAMPIEKIYDQPLYTAVMPESGTGILDFDPLPTYYVWQSTLVPAGPMLVPPPEMERFVGEFFKRWADDGTGYVSNMRDRFPAD